MKRLLLLLLVCLTVPAIAPAQTARYIVVTHRPAEQARARIFASDAAARGHRVRSFHSVNAFAADLTADEVAALRQSPDVQFLSPVVPRHIDATTTAAPRFHPTAELSPLESAQSIPWGIDAVKARDLWSMSRGKGTVHVAILDTGVDSTHPDVAANVAAMYDVTAQTNTASDGVGHGTHVAGTIAAIDNGVGVVGVAPEAKLWIVKVLDDSGNGTDETVVAGIDKVLEWKHALGGQWIVSCSFGAADPSDAERAAYQQLWDEGVLAIAAAGNTGLPNLEYPGAYPTVLSVGAVDANLRLASFSSWGTNIGVVAPGVRVLSSIPVGTGLTAGARLDSSSDWIQGFPFTGAPKTELHGAYVNCGLGQPTDFPPEVRGNIALMERGTLTFAEKVRNAVDAGAIGAMIYNNDTTDPNTWTLYRLDCTNNNCQPYPDDVAYNWPPVVALRNTDGVALAKAAQKTVTIGEWVDDYGLKDGTSMATPHVSGVAALIWALAPAATAAQVRNAITASAHDLGDPGYDISYGYGLVDAPAAATLLGVLTGVPASPAPTDPGPPKHRSAGH